MLERRGDLSEDSFNNSGDVGLSCLPILRTARSPWRSSSIFEEEEGEGIEDYLVRLERLARVLTDTSPVKSAPAKLRRPRRRASTVY
jgi:hypothetical protein